MIVTSSGKIIAGSRILINDSINEFLGTVNNLWSNPANWSLGIIPTTNHIAIIKADCIQNIDFNIKILIVNSNISLISQIRSRSINEGLKNYGTIDFRLGNDTLNGNISNYYFGNILYNSSYRVTLNLIGIYDFPTVFKERLVTNLPPSYSEVSFNDDIYLAEYRRFGNLFVTKFKSNKVITFNYLHIDSHGNNVVFEDDTKVVVLNGCYIYSNSPIVGNNVELIFRGGSPSILHGNINFPSTSKVVFETNNSNFNSTGVSGIYLRNIEIRGVTVDYTPTSDIPSTGNITIININGTNPSSVWNNKYTLIVEGSSPLMPIGKFNANFVNSIVTYNNNGNQDVRVPDDGKYMQLRLANSGVKKLTGNIQCDHLYFAGTATLDLNGFNLTGYTKYTDARNRASTVPLGNYTNVEFKDENLNTVQTLTNGSTVDELIWRGGNFTIGTNTPVFVLNGINPTQWRFIRQFYQQINNITFTFSNVRLEMEAGTPGGLTLNNSNITITGTLDFRRNGLVILNGTSSITCNTLALSLAGAQDIPANVGFTNLTIGGNGMKTLTGNIIVTGTYYRDNINTVFNKNGFTIKNSSGVDLE